MFPEGGKKKLKGAKVADVGVVDLELVRPQGHLCKSPVCLVLWRSGVAWCFLVWSGVFGVAWCGVGGVTWCGVVWRSVV